MTDQPSVKLFDLNRMAKFVDPRKQTTVYVVPGEVLAIVSLDSGETWIDYGHNKNLLVQGDMQSVEDELNRALGATYAAHLQASREASDKLKDMLKSVQMDDEEVMKFNDFIPKGVN